MSLIPLYGLIMQHLFTLKVKLLTLFLLLAFLGQSQQSGRVFEFLNLPSTARIAAIGGYAAPSLEDDIGTALFYPSLLRPSLSSHLSLNFVNYHAGINYGTVAFSQNFEKFGTFSAAVNYINYGNFIEADETGLIHGEFSGGEMSLMVGWGKQLSERISLGTNIKFITSSIHEFSSTGIAADVSLSYLNPETEFAAGIVARNIGRQLSSFREGAREPLPFDLVFGASKKLLNAPFRFSLVLHNLQRFDLTYESQIDQEFQFGQEPTSTQGLSDFFEKLLRHAVFGVDLIPTNNFALRVGYNYRRSQELGDGGHLSTVGFSFGFGIKISRFHFNYGWANYHRAGATNHISISTSLRDLLFSPVATSPVPILDEN